MALEQENDIAADAATRLFLPDLCSARSVFIVVVVAELLAVVLSWRPTITKALISSAWR